MLAFLLVWMAQSQLVDLDFGHQGLLQTLVFQITPLQKSVELTSTGDLGAIEGCEFIVQPQQDECSQGWYHFMEAEECWWESNRITFPRLGSFYLMLRFRPIERAGTITVENHFTADFITLLPSKGIPLYELGISSMECDIGAVRRVGIEVEGSVVVNLENREFHFLGLCTNCVVFSRQQVRAAGGGRVEFAIQCPNRVSASKVQFMVMRGQSREVVKMKEVRVETRQQALVNAVVAYPRAGQLYKHALNAVGVQFQFPFNMPQLPYILKLSAPGMVGVETTLDAECSVEGEVSCPLEELASGITYQLSLLLQPSEEQPLVLEVFLRDDQQVSVIREIWEPTFVEQDKDGFVVTVFRDRLSVEFAFSEDDFQLWADSNAIVLAGDVLLSASDCSSDPFYPSLCSKEAAQFTVSFGAQNQLVFPQQPISLVGSFAQTTSPITLLLECYRDLTAPPVKTYLLNGIMVYDVPPNAIQVQLFNFWKGSVGEGVDLTFLQVTGPEQDKHFVMYYEGFQVLDSPQIQGVGYSLQYGSKVHFTTLPFECFIRPTSGVVRARVASLDGQQIVASLSAEYSRSFPVASEDPYEFAAQQSASFTMVDVRRQQDAVTMAYRGDPLPKVTLLFDAAVHSDDCQVIGEVRMVCDWQEEVSAKGSARLLWVGIGDETLRILHPMHTQRQRGAIHVLHCDPVMVGHRNQLLNLILNLDNHFTGYLRLQGNLGFTVDQAQTALFATHQLPQIQVHGTEILLQVDHQLPPGEHHFTIRGLFTNLDWQYSSQELSIQTTTPKLQIVDSGLFRIQYLVDRSDPIQILDAYLSVQYIKSIGDLYLKYVVRRQINILHLVSTLQDQQHLQCFGCFIDQDGIHLSNTHYGEYEVRIKGIRIQNYRIFLQSDYYISNEIQLVPTILTSTLDYTQLQLDKIPGLYPEFIFTFKAYNIRQIYIHYPIHYHKPTMNNLLPYCLIDNKIYVVCDYLDDQLILVIRNLNHMSGSFSVNIKYSALQVRATSEHQFYVEFHYEDSIQFGFIDDLPNSLVDPAMISIQSMEVSSSEWVLPLELKVRMYSESLVPRIYLSFDHKWFRKDNANRVGGCTLGGKVVECRFEGQLLIVEGQLEGESELVLKELPAPQNDQCISKRLQVNNSPFYLSNMQEMAFRISDDARLWKWTSQGQVITSLTLHPGVYSPALHLIPADSYRIKHDLNVSTPHFVLSHSQLPQGSYQVSIRIGCPVDTLPGSYPTSFFLNDTSHYYNPPQLLILVSSSPAPLTIPSDFSFYVPLLGYSLPLFLETPYLPLEGSLIIQASLPLIPDLRIDFAYNSQVNFSLNDCLNWLQLKSQDQPNVIQSESQIEFAIVDNAFFQLSGTSLEVQLNALNEESSLPLPTIAVEVQSILHTSITLTIQPNQQLLYYYCLTLNDPVYTPNRDYLHSFDYCAVKPGQPSTRTAGTSKFGVFTADSLTIPQLLSNMEYNLTIHAASLHSQRPTPFNQVFKTTHNNDNWWKAQSHTHDLCLLASYFRYSTHKVMDINGYTCQSPPPYSIPINIFYFRPYQDIENPYVANPYEVQLFQSSQLQIEGVNFIKIINQVVPSIQEYSQIISDPQEITIKSLKLSNNGFIWAVAEKQNMSIKGRMIYTKPKLLAELKLGYQYQNDSSYAFAIYDDEPVDITFGNLLPESRYRITLIATTEDPSEYQKESKAVFYETDTPPLGSLVVPLMTMVILFLH